VDSVEVRVKRGTRIMDETVQGWYQNVDLSTLNMTNGDLCVAGQAVPLGGGNEVARRYENESGYWAMKIYLEKRVEMGTLPPEASVVWAGFSPIFSRATLRGTDADDLAEAWTAEILERRHRDAASILEA